MPLFVVPLAPGFFRRRDGFQRLISRLRTAGSRLLVAQLFEVSSLDPLALGGAAVLLLAIGIGAAFVPARRASRLDPVRALPES